MYFLAAPSFPRMIIPRRSARIATRTPVSYSQYFNESDSDSSTESSIVNKCNSININDHQALADVYLRGSVNIIKTYLDECNQARGCEQKCAVVKKLFEYLIANPEICIIYPRFRFMVKAKVDEFKTLLQSYKSDFNLDSEAKNIIDAIVAAKAKIHHTDYNEKLSSKLNDIKDILYSYNEYTHNQPLLITLNSMEKTLEDIKKNPSYVVDSNGN